MQQVTTKMFAEMCGVSDANIRKLIGDSKINAVKGQRGGYLIDVEDKINRIYLDEKRGVAKPITQQIRNESQTCENDTIARLTQQIEQLAKQAGKAELLTDNLIQQKNDVEYWRNLYFKLQHDCENLRIENTQLRQQQEKPLYKRLKWW